MNAVEYCLLHGLKLVGPEHPAILCAQESLSYGALAARVSQFAAGLRQVGIRPNDRVGMLMLDTPDLIALHLGAIATGAIAVAMSSRASAAELVQILAIVRPAAVVIDAEFAGVAASALAASSPNTKLIRRERSAMPGRLPASYFPASRMAMFFLSRLLARTFVLTLFPGLHAVGSADKSILGFARVAPSSEFHLGTTSAPDWRPPAAQPSRLPEVVLAQTHPP